MTDCIAADCVGKRLRGRRVLTSASIRVRPGRITALLGRNGCGKTTLLRILIGFMRADHGRVLLAGEHLPRPRPGHLATEGMFFIPERDLLARHRTFREHLQRLGRRFGKSDASEAVRVTGVGSVLDRRPGKMSGGERRRAEAALALFREPRFLLADEAFMGVAPKDAEVIAAAYRRLADRGCGILITGHEVETLLDLADEVVWMTAGTTYPLGTPAEARRHHWFARDYLGPQGGTTAARESYGPGYD